jgi:hypothetical protein
MFLDNDKKIICLSVPKTATQSCSMFFRENLKLGYGSEIKIAHLTVGDLIARGKIKHPIEEYSIYGIIRNPLSRFLSSINHLDEFDGNRCDTKDKLILYGEEILFKKSDKMFEGNRMLFRPQVDWLKIPNINVNIYPYEKLNDFVSHICDLYNIDFNKFLSFEKIHVGKVSVSIDDLGYRMKKRILEIYKEDYDLYNSLK